MCTAICYHTNNHYFGRNLDYEYSFPCNIIVTPGNFPFPFRQEDPLPSHYSMIGMGMVQNGYPLYYDATNEYGLSMAGLNFPGNAVYQPIAHGRNNITPFELIPWILGQCRTVEEARNLIENLNILDVAFRKDIPLSPLHWIIADQTEAITIEPTDKGVMLYDNPVGVLTNNPPFPYHMANMCNYMNITAAEVENRICRQLNFESYSRGLGSYGLPGDWSSASRFVRAAFVKWNSPQIGAESESVTQFFHFLDSVMQIYGCVQVGDQYEKTLYSSCCNMDTGTYYYTSYENRQITAVPMDIHDLNATKLTVYSMRTKQSMLTETKKVL